MVFSAALNSITIYSSKSSIVWALQSRRCIYNFWLSAIGMKYSRTKKTGSMALVTKKKYSHIACANAIQRAPSSTCDMSNIDSAQCPYTIFIYIRLIFINMYYCFASIHAPQTEWCDGIQNDKPLYSVIVVAAAAVSHLSVCEFAKCMHL